MDVYDLILYTDGSYKDYSTQHGYCGSGVHGYYYSRDSKHKLPKKDYPSQWMITNFGYLKIDQPYHREQKDVHPVAYVDGVFSYNNPGTNMYGEVMGLWNSIREAIARHDAGELSINGIRVLYDCNYVKQVHDKIVHQEYDNNVANLHLYKEGEQVLQDLKDRHISLTLSKVDAHTGDLGNELADKLSKIGRRRSTLRDNKNEFVVSDVKDYWSVVDKPPPLLNYKQLFFTNTIRLEHDNLLYALMDYKTDDSVGIKTSDALFGIVELSEPVKFIEDVIRYYYNFVYHMPIVSTVNLKNLYTRNNIFYYRLFGTDIFDFNTRNMEVLSFDQLPVVYTIKPIALAGQMINNVLKLDKQLKVTNEDPDTQVVDITDMIYTTKTVKKKGSKEPVIQYSCILKQDLKVLTIDLEKFSIKLDLGKDTITRNSFKQIEIYDPKVELVVIKLTDNAYSYVTRIFQKNGVKSVMCNYYSGRIYLGKSIR